MEHFNWTTADNEAVERERHRIIEEDDGAGATNYIKHRDNMTSRIMLFWDAISHHLYDTEGYAPSMNVLAAVKASGFSLPIYGPPIGGNANTFNESILRVREYITTHLENKNRITIADHLDRRIENVDPVRIRAIVDAGAQTSGVLH